jgi:hypothetical protein
MLAQVDSKIFMFNQITNYKIVQSLLEIFGFATDFCN